MHPIGKMIAGLILILVGLGLYAMPQLQIVDWLGNFIILVTGSIPILLILIGLFVIWLEADELKVSKEFDKEDKKESGGEEEKPKQVAKKAKRKPARKKRAVKKESVATEEEPADQM
ncbi:MAG: hypothetical protein JW716_04655 [Candidatus Aenigmarchaeota archaeon]|nr:hypothetical protein [Candidatus Aenigmarchaeota archaeon]